LIHLAHLTCGMGLSSATFSETQHEDHILIVYVLEKDMAIILSLNVQYLKIMRPHYLQNYIHPQM
jgi:hypothetical protein